MGLAAEEEREVLGLRNDKDDLGKCGVFIDGSWQRRGHSSHNAVITAISLETDKCLDVEVLTNVCRDCKRWESKENLSMIYGKQIMFVS